MLIASNSYAAEQAKRVTTNVTNFNNNLSASDTTVQAALETIDNLTLANNSIFVEDSATTGNVVYVGCSDSIATAISDATAGDTLILGSCTYNISAEIAINKAITIKGQGIKSTTLSVGTASFIAFNVTSDDVSLEDFKLLATESNISASGLITFNGTGGSTLLNVWVRNLYIDITNDPSVATAIYFNDAGGGVENTYIHTKSVVGSSQTYGIKNFFNSTATTADSDINFIVKNTIIELEVTDTGIGQIRPLMIWHNAATKNAFSQYVFISNVNTRVTPFSNANLDVEALQLQSNNAAYNAGVNGKVEAWIINSSFDSAWKKTTTAAGNGWKNMRVDDYAIAHLSNVWTNPKGTIQNQNNGVIYREGIIDAYGIRNTQPDEAPTSLDATDLINISGQAGGVKLGTGSQTGLEGANVIITLGTGGKATEATTTGTSGTGGDFVITAGAGGSQDSSTSTTNVGGVGGYIELNAGVGGAASNAATTNTGGVGGSVYISSGQGGVGTTTTGAVGDIFIGKNSSNVESGNVNIGENVAIVSPSKLQIVDGGSSTSGTTLNLYKNDTTIVANDIMGKIMVYGNDTSLSSNKEYGSIEMQAVSTVTTDVPEGRWMFKAVPASGTVPLEILRISGAGLVFNEQSYDGLSIRFEGNADSTLFYSDGANDRIGIGTSTPQNKIDIEGKMVIGSTYSGTSACTATNGLCVEGNVGIGTTNPLTKLHVAGDTTVGGEINITGVSSDGVGKVLCVKGNGDIGTCSTIVDVSGVCTCN